MAISLDCFKQDLINKKRNKIIKNILIQKIRWLKRTKDCTATKTFVTEVLLMHFAFSTFALRAILIHFIIYTFIMVSTKSTTLSKRGLDSVP